MNLQYISDNKGQTTGVFIPIQDWNQLKKKYDGLVKEEQAFDIPEWHKSIIDRRLAAYKANPNNVIDFDKACDDIENELLISYFTGCKKYFRRCLKGVRQISIIKETFFEKRILLLFLSKKVTKNF